MRQSNIELLRIVCMFMVMCLHATLAIGYPEVTTVDPMEYFSIGLVKAFCIVAVDVFIMISGYFGIKFSVKGLFTFLFQVLFFSVIGYFLSLIFHVQDFSFKNFISQGLLLGAKNYWFVQCYLLLYITSPILNAFAENVPQKTFRTFLVVFYCVQTIFAWQFATLSSKINAGESYFSFIGLYLLLRYYRIYGIKFTELSRKNFLLIYFSISLFIALISYYSHGGIVMYVGHYSYASPFVIISSFALFLFFLKLSIQSRRINLIASSCFAVYLLHEQCAIRETLYRPFLSSLYYSKSPYLSGSIDTIVFMVIVYTVAIMLDKVRMVVSGRLLGLK